MRQIRLKIIPAIKLRKICTTNSINELYHQNKKQFCWHDTSFHRLCSDSATAKFSESDLLKKKIPWMTYIKIRSYFICGVTKMCWLCLVHSLFHFHSVSTFFRCVSLPFRGLLKGCQKVWKLSRVVSTYFKYKNELRANRWTLCCLK